MTIITVTMNTSVDRTLEVPHLAVGAHLKARLLRLQPGGKGVNVARCLAALGVPSIVTGLVGSTELGLFRESFAGAPATVELTPIAQPARTCTTLLDPEAGTDTHIREQGPTVTPGEIEALETKLRALALPDALIVFCGSLPPGMADAHLAGLLAVCQARGARVAADLNGAQLAAVLAAPFPPAKPSAAAMGAGTSVPQLNNCGTLLIKPNVEELGECLGRELRGAGEPELVAAARALLDRVGTVLVTRGREGALAVTPHEALAASVDVGVPRNTVGCGDAFLARYLAAMWRGMAPADALRLAAACGAAQAEADASGRLSAAQVERLAARASLRALA